MKIFSNCVKVNRYNEYSFSLSYVLVICQSQLNVEALEARTMTDAN